MQRQPVTSSNIVSIGYDVASATLEIEFDKGSAYQYTGVPAEVHRQLMSAPSHGIYFNAHIKNSFPTRRVS